MFFRQRHLLLRRFRRDAQRHQPEQRLRVVDERRRDADLGGGIGLGSRPEPTVDIQQSIEAKEISENL